MNTENQPRSSLKMFNDSNSHNVVQKSSCKGSCQYNPLGRGILSYMYILKIEFETQF